MPLVGRLAGTALDWALGIRKLWTSIHRLYCLFVFSVSSGPALLLLVVEEKGMEGEVLGDALGGHVLVLPQVYVSEHTPWRWPTGKLMKFLVPFRACEEH